MDIQVLFLGGEIVCINGSELSFPFSKVIDHKPEKPVKTCVYYEHTFIFLHVDGTLTSFTKSNILLYVNTTELLNVRDIYTTRNSLLIIFNDDTLIIYGSFRNILSRENKTNVKTIHILSEVVCILYNDNTCIGFTEYAGIIPRMTHQNISKIIIVPSTFILFVSTDNVIVHREIRGFMTNDNVLLRIEDSVMLNENNEIIIDYRIHYSYVIHDKLTNVATFYICTASEIVSQHIVNDVKFINRNLINNIFVIVKQNGTIEQYRVTLDLVFVKMNTPISTMTNVEHVFCGIYMGCHQAVVIHNDFSMTGIFDRKMYSFMKPRDLNESKNYKIEHIPSPFVLF